MDFTTNILLSIAVFLGVILLLVALLLWVRNKLMPKGEVKITINDDKELTVPVGNTLINTLAEQKVYLPSACGGKGSCGQCKCRVVEGGGTILPTEVASSGIASASSFESETSGCGFGVPGRVLDG